MATAVSAYGTWTCATEPVRCLTSRTFSVANVTSCWLRLRSFNWSRRVLSPRIEGMPAILISGAARCNRPRTEEAEDFRSGRLPQLPAVRYPKQIANTWHPVVAFSKGKSKAGRIEGVRPVEGITWSSRRPQRLRPPVGRGLKVEGSAGRRSGRGALPPGRWGRGCRPPEGRGAPPAGSIDPMGRAVDQS